MQRSALGPDGATPLGVTGGQVLVEGEVGTSWTALRRLCSPPLSSDLVPFTALDSGQPGPQRLVAAHELAPWPPSKSTPATGVPAASVQGRRSGGRWEELASAQPRPRPSWQHTAVESPGGHEELAHMLCPGACLLCAPTPARHPERSRAFSLQGPEPGSGPWEDPPA